MAKRRRRRVWEDEEKQRIVAQTQVLGVSVSQVACRYDVNANLVFKWLRDPRFRSVDEDVELFLPVEALPEPVAPIVKPEVSAGKIEIQLSNGHRLSVSGAFDPDAVARLLRGLSR